MSWKSLFTRKNQPQLSQSAAHELSVSPLDAVESVFKVLTGTLNQSSEVDELTQQYKHSLTLPPPERESVMIAVYFAFETYITTHLPPVTKASYTITRLRQEIRQAVKLDNLAIYFRLIFLPEVPQAQLLFNLEFDAVVQFLVENLGLQRTQRVVTAGSRQSLLTGVKVTSQGLLMDELLKQKLLTLSLPQVIQMYHQLFETAYAAIVSSLGEKQAIALFGRIFGFVKGLYSYDIIAVFLDAMPQVPFATERLRLVSRLNLEKTVIERTAELATAKHQVEEKYQQIEKQNLELARTKQAVINLLEDARELEIQIKEERDRAQAIISSMGEGLYVADKNLRVLTINPSAEKLLGLSRDEVIGKKWSDIVSVYKGVTALPVSNWPVSQTLSTGKTVAVGIDDDYFFTTIKGKKFPVAITTAPLLGDGVTGAVIVFRDVTPEKEEKALIEEIVAKRTLELREQYARFVASIQSLPGGFIMTDREGHVLLTNQLLEKILGRNENHWKIEEVASRLLGCVDVLAQFTKCIQEQKTVTVKNIQFISHIIDFYVIPVFISPQSQELIGTIILIEDVTEVKVLERSKDEFFSIASHELRTPLTAIRGNTALIKEYYAEKFQDKGLIEMIDDIHESSVRLIEMVNDFLNLSRLEQGKIEYKKETFSIEPLIDIVIKELLSLATPKNLQLLYIKPDKPIGSVLADQERVKEVLLNIISNAIKFTDKGGVTVTVQQEDQNLKVLITDTGRGISYKQQALLFRKFQQAGESLYTRDTTRGTGLGLYISKLILEGMGGKIWLEKSVAGQGSTFAFSLPLVMTSDL